MPAGSMAQLPTEEVVDLYRERMHIELTFRDWKTHLGVRGLRLQVDMAPRLSRLLLALSIAYVLAVVLGAGPLAARVRAHTEVLCDTRRRYDDGACVPCLCTGIKITQSMFIDYRARGRRGE